MFILTADHGRTDVEPHAEDQKLLPDLLGVLPAGSHVAVNGGIGYIYLSKPEEAVLTAMAAVIESNPKLAAAIASVRPRHGDDSPRAGDLIVTLRQGHYFNNPGSGSQHGSTYPQDLGVPLLVAMPGAGGVHVTQPVRTTQIARTIADYLGFPMELADPALPVRRRVRTSMGQ
jgi:arylsulfatase A-like enzyme